MKKTNTNKLYFQQKTPKNDWNDPTITLDDLQSEVVYHYYKAIEDGNDALVNSLEKILDELKKGIIR